MIFATGKKCTRKRGSGSAISSQPECSERGSPGKKASAAGTPPSDAGTISRPDRSSSRDFDLFRLAPIGYLVLNPQGLILEANLAAANRLGVARSSLKDKNLEQFISPCDRELFRSHLQRIFSNVSSGKCYVTMMPKGEPRLISRLESNPVRDDDDALYCLTVIVDIPAEEVAYDITERLAAEKRLRKENREIELANRILRIFVEETGDILYDKALDILLEGMQSRHGVFGYLDERGVLICPSLSRMIDECEIDGKCIHYPPDKWKGLWARALRERQALYTNEPPPVPSGHPFIQNNLAAPILFQGSVIGLFNLANKKSDYAEEDRELLGGISERIAPVLFAWIQKELREAERAQAEAALRQSQADFSRAQEVGNIGSWRLDVRKNVLMWSDENHRIFGIPKGTSLTYETFLSTVHPDDRDYVDARWKAGLEGEPYDIEHRLLVNGRIKWVREKAYLEFDEIGRLIGGFGITQDITERKQAEQALKKAHEELEQHVAQRTRFYNIRAQINRAAIRSRDIREYLDEVCAVMTETGGFKLAWVGIVDPCSREVSVTASKGETGYLEGIRIVAADQPEGSGPTGLAIREGRHIINLDYETNEMMLPWRESARRHALRSSSAFPLRVYGKIVGALTIYSGQPFFFTGEELSVLLNIADDISFAMEAFETERKRLRAEQELHITAAELQDLYNNAPCGYHSLDRDGVIVRINKTELDWLGYSYNEVVGNKKITDFYTSDGIRTFNEGYAEFMRRGTVDDVELELVRRDGTIMHVVHRGTAIYDADGEYVMSRSMLYDVTDRKKAEKQSIVINALLSLYARKFDRKAYLNAAVELIRGWSGCRHIGIRVVDAQKSIPYLSCIGFSEEFLASEQTLFLERDHCVCTRIVLGAPEPQDLPAMTAAGSLYLNNAARFMEGLTEEQQSRYRSICVKSGFLSLVVVPIRYSDRILGAFHMADEREGMVSLPEVEFLEKMALIVGQAIYRFGVEEERMRLASALESSADGVVVTHSRHGRIEYVNRAFEQITGYAKEEAVGNTLHLLDSGRHNEAFFEELRSTLRRDGIWRGRLINKKKDGTLYFEDCTFSPVRDHAGHILNYVSIRRDVTEKLRMESIAESVSMMDNIGAVLAGVRHEIGNPVNNVKMMLSVLQRRLNELAPDRVRYYIDRMYGEIGRVEQLLSTLKAFNLFETPVVENLNAVSLLNLFRTLVREDLEARGIALSIQILPGAEWMQADARALQHVLLNLTTNAADALKDRDHPRISITLSREDDRVHIRISDNGAGMTAEQQKNLFKPFQTTKANGTGLGLVIVKKMLASIKGSIGIESKAGSGTVVHVHLPSAAKKDVKPGETLKRFGLS